jgi:hypothetical protein
MKHISLVRPWLLGMAVLLMVSWTGCESGDSESGARNVTGTESGKGIAFTDVTAPAGLEEFRHRTGAFGEKWNPESMGAGGGFIDYNGDGWLDILLVAGGLWPQHTDRRIQGLRLYRNNRDGTFSEVTAEAGLAGVTAYGFGVTVADYDNDGDQDFFLTTLNENLLFEHEDGIFSEVSREVGLGQIAEWSSAAVFFDADRDGWLDLYVGNYIDWSPETNIWCTVGGKYDAYCTPEVYEGVAGRYYHNNGDGTFTERTKAAGFRPAPGKALGALELDFNHDGWPDLAVANDLERNLLYVNNGDGTFTEQGVRSGIAYDENGIARAGMGIDAGVVDSTGEPSIFVGNFSTEMTGVFRHMEEGLFVDRAATSRVGLASRPILTFGLLLFDVELDGNLDLFAANGHMQPAVDSVANSVSYRQPPHLYVNQDKSGRFEEISRDVGGVFERRLVARGAAYGDYDRDGDLDILLTENGGPAHLWRNESKRGHFLRVDLRGIESNREGIGARIVLEVEGHRAERRVRAGSSYLSQSEKTVTLGIGPATTVEKLMVFWPSGTVDRFEDILADREILVTEGKRRYTVRRAFNGGPVDPR